MKASLFDALEHLRFIDADMPSIGDHDVLIETLRVGICGSEMHAFKGTHPFRNPPSVLGHEVVGRVREIGRSVTHVHENDLVTVEPQYGCDNCARCAEGQYNLCAEKIILGTETWPGAFADYVRAPARTVYRLDPKVPLERAALVEPLAVGVHAARVAEIEPGDRVAILGSGPIGLLTAVAAHAAGAEAILMTDVADRNLEVARRLVLADIVDVRAEESRTRLETLAGTFDVVCLTVGLPSVLDSALQLVQRRGRVISVALFEEPAPVNFNRLMIGEFTLRGSSMYVREDFQAAINLVTARDYALDDLITHRFDFNDIDEAMALAATRRDQPIKVMLDMSV